MSRPWNDSLPTSLVVGGELYQIRSDYRSALDICAAVSDPDLTDQERAIVSLDILYPSFENMPVERYREALDRCMWFINCGEDPDNSPAPRLVDWERDFRYIVTPINRVLGQEVRGLEYLHWWTFIAAYYEIGDCTFAQIVRIRNLKAKGKKMDKADQEWYRNNRDLVDFKQTYTEAENEVLKAWGV